MQNFTDYSYTIPAAELERTAREAAAAGYTVTVIINGEYYDVNTDDSKPGRIAAIADRLSSLAERLNPYTDDGTTPADHMQILKIDPYDVIEQLIDVFEEMQI